MQRGVDWLCWHQASAEQQKGPRDASARYGTLSQNGYGAHWSRLLATSDCCIDSYSAVRMIWIMSMICTMAQLQCDALQTLMVVSQKRISRGAGQQGAQVFCWIRIHTTYLQTASGQLEVARLDNESSTPSCCCEESRLSTCSCDGFRRTAVGNLY